MTDHNIILNTDSYKLSHAAQYPAGTTNIFSYFESRVGAKFDETVFFGLQALLRRYLAGPVVTAEKIAEAASLAEAHVGFGIFNRKGWEYILHAHRGRLPVRIRCVPEGTPVPTSNVLMTIEATDPRCYWLPNYLETLLVQVWYPSTVATLSRAAKRVMLDFLDQTGGNASVAEFMLHDFGFRGVSSVESAGLGGLAHLVNFRGTDTIAALVEARRSYDAECAGFSIPASEHSTITSWGRAREVDAYRNMLRTYPTGLVACVSDSYDVEEACRLWGGPLRSEVLARSGRLVVRPDSGDPATTVVRCLEILGHRDRFGSSLNAKGFRVLHDQVRVIQGDGCTLETIGEILAHMRDHAWAAENVAFGMGGGLLQKVDRDTQRFAFKCSARESADGWMDVYKDPKTDPSKASKRGRLKLVNEGGDWSTRRIEEPGRDEMVTVFENGAILRTETLDGIRGRAALEPEFAR